MSMREYYDWDYLDQYDSEPEVLLGVKLIHETAKAYLIEHRNRHAWFPKSICTLEEDCLEYPDWFDPTWQKQTPTKRRMPPIDGDF